jgi:hypothetical protein
MFCALVRLIMSRVHRTRWGGIVDDRLRPPDFFSVERIEGVWWLIDPEGGRFISKGVNCVDFDQDNIKGTQRAPYAEACKRKYASLAGWRVGWRVGVARRLLSWGFNTTGAWSDDYVGRSRKRAPGGRKLARTPNIELGYEFQHRRRRPDYVVPDVFDPEFGVFAKELAADRCAPQKKNRTIIGWFLDNELHWGDDKNELLTLFLNQSSYSPGRVAAVRFLQNRYGRFEAFNAVWKSSARTWDDLGRVQVEQPFLQTKTQKPRAGSRDVDLDRTSFEADCDAFAGLVADRYFTETVAATKAADPNHLVLGCRFKVPPRRPVIEAAGKHLDVISFNCYEPSPRGQLRAYDAYKVAGRPLLIGEFSFRADDAGLPNKNPQKWPPRCKTQVDRAIEFRNYVMAALKAPKVIGYHWFEHADQPAEGRDPDGQDSNFGLVSIKDVAYRQLTHPMAALNKRAEDVHASSARRGSAEPPGKRRARRSQRERKRNGARALAAR